MCGLDINLNLAIEKFFLALRRIEERVQVSIEFPLSNYAFSWRIFLSLSLFFKGKKKSDTTNGSIKGGGVGGFFVVMCWRN